MTDEFDDLTDDIRREVEVNALSEHYLDVSLKFWEMSQTVVDNFFEQNFTFEQAYRTMEQQNPDFKDTKGELLFTVAWAVRARG